MLFTARTDAALIFNLLMVTGLLAESIVINSSATTVNSLTMVNSSNNNNSSISNTTALNSTDNNENEPTDTPGDTVITTLDDYMQYLNNFTNLLKNYPGNGSVPPTYDFTSIFPVMIYLGLQTFQGIDDQTQDLTCTGYITLTWIDEFLTLPNVTFATGDPQFDAVLSKVTLRRNQIWSPQIGFPNDPRGPFALLRGLSDNDDHVMADVVTGEVIWYPGGTFVVSCNLIYRLFPWDDQYCEMSVSFWSIPGWVEFSFSDPAVITAQELGASLQASLWTITNISHYDASAKLNVATVVFGFSVSRLPGYYMYTILYPDAVLVALTLGGLFNPHDNSRPAYFLVLMLTFGVLISDVNDLIPPTSTEICYMTVTLAIHLGLAAVYTIQSLIFARFLSMRDVYGQSESRNSRLKFFCSWSFSWLGTVDPERIEAAANISDVIMLCGGAIASIGAPVFLYLYVS